jgi:hypothetical protein
LNRINLDQTANSDLETSDQLAALDALVQSELSLVSQDLDHLSIRLTDGLDLSTGEKSTLEIPTLDASIDEGIGNSILVAQADTSSETLTDLPNPVLAQFYQSTPQKPADQPNTKLAENSISIGGGDGLNWPVIGGALGGAFFANNWPSSIALESQADDKIGPQANLIFAGSPTNISAGTKITLTITFSEAVKGFEIGDLTPKDGSLSNLQQSNSDPLIWTVLFTANKDINNIDSVVQLSDGYTDLAGNKGASAKTEKGVVADGYIFDATVFRDLNGNGQLDNGEFSVKTDEFGNFSGLGGFGGKIDMPVL